MKKIHTTTKTIGDLNVELEREYDTKYWTFVFERVAYPEIVFDPERGEVTYPNFIPLDQLVRDIIDGLASSEIVTCVVCRAYFALDEEEGIFGDPEKLERFICRACSESMSGRDFYFRYLTGRG